MAKFVYCLDFAVCCQCLLCLLAQKQFQADSKRTVLCGKSRRNDGYEVSLESYGPAFHANHYINYDFEIDGFMEFIYLASFGKYPGRKRCSTDADDYKLVDPFFYGSGNEHGSSADEDGRCGYCFVTVIRGVHFL